MRVLVTGHKGFIGSVMVPALLRDGIDVDGMDTDLYRECTFAGSLARVPEIEGDIRDAAPADLEGFDAVIHLAALSNDPLGDFNPELTCEINHRATTHLARLARDASSRFGSTGASARSSSSWRADGWVPKCVGRDDDSSGRIVQRRAPSLVCGVRRRCCAGLVLAALTVVAGRGAAGTCQPRPA
jgi:hypothetical protein